MAAQPRSYANSTAYMPNGANSGGLNTSAPGMNATPLLPNQGRVLQSGSSRVLCVADVRGNLSSLNDLAKSARADYVIHTGDFGFYDESSLDRIADKTLKHVAQYSPLLAEDVRRQIANAPSLAAIKEQTPRQHMPLSQLPLFLNGSLKFDVPVYAVWGACEDVQVLEKLRSGEYKIDKLHILDEAHSRLLEVGGVRLRLLGLGGAVVMHKLFDNGEGRTTIAGGQGTMWTTLLQMGELVDTANRTYDPNETRVFVTHASPAREGLLNQLAVALKADFSISGGLHFRYGSSYNEFSVNPSLDHFRGKLAASKASFQDVWDTVKSEVEPIVAENEAHQKLLHNALEVVNKMPSVASGSNPFGGSTGPSTGQVDESAFKNMWNFNLADAAFGWLVLDIEGGRIGTEMKALGFNFSHRGLKAAQQVQDSLKSTAAVSQPMQNLQQTPVSQAAAQVQQPRAGQIRAQQVPTQPRNLSGTTPQPQNVGRPNAPATQPLAAQSGPNAAINGTTGDTRANGLASPTPALDTTTKPSTPPIEKKPSSGIFVENVGTEEEVRKLFSEEDQTKIQKIDKMGHASRNWAVHFETPEIMQAVLSATQAATPAAPGKPRMKVFEHRPRRDFSSRPTPQGGYKSDRERGQTSDSEGGNRGRGGAGFRGRGGRGSDRGRGGPGRGRGQFGKAEGAVAAPVPSTPAQ